MLSIQTLIVAAGLMLGALLPANAAMKKVRVPNQYDGSWTILSSTAEGPCSTTKNYQVRIKDSEASIPGEDTEVEGGVSADGSVQATIVQGSNRFPITGKLNSKGTGLGTWRTSGGLVECSGSWSAKRAG